MDLYRKPINNLVYFLTNQYTRQFSKEGMGMGLWIAQKILEAHDSKLIYFKDNSATGGIGLNIFEFDLNTLS